VVLVDWVTERWRRGLILDAADTMIPDVFNPDEVSLVLKLGLLCSHPLPNARPTMRQVMQYLDGDMVLPDLSPEYFGFAVMERMYSRELSKETMACVSSSMSMGAISDLSRGR
jgi:hypothetical protein